MLFSDEELKKIRELSQELCNDIGLTQNELKEIKKNSNLNIIELMKNFLVSYSIFKSLSMSEKLDEKTKNKIIQITKPFTYTNKIRLLLIKHTQSFDKDRELEALTNLVENDIEKIDSFTNFVFMTTKILSEEDITNYNEGKQLGQQYVGR